MITVTTQVELDKMIKVLDAIKRGFSEGLQVAGDHVVNLASQLAPKDSGDLSESGRNVVVNDTANISFGNGLPDDRAIAQEYGTMYMPAQPYLGPALKEIDIVEEIATAVRRRIT